MPDAHPPAEARVISCARVPRSLQSTGNYQLSTHTHLRPIISIAVQALEFSGTSPTGTPPHTDTQTVKEQAKHPRLPGSTILGRGPHDPTATSRPRLEQLPAALRGHSRSRINWNPDPVQDASSQAPDSTGAFPTSQTRAQVSQ